MSTQADELVKRGAELLDSRRPGWERLVRLTKLDLLRPSCCILGQVYGGYNVGKNTLFWDHQDPYHLSTVAGDHGFIELDLTRPVEAAWRKLIRHRRKRRAHASKRAD